MSDAMQLKTMLAGTVILVALLIFWIWVERYRRVNGPGSARIANTTAFANLKKKIGPVLEKGDEIVIPAGIGRYPEALKDGGRNAWEKQIADWVRSGIRITYILTSPTADTLQYWQRLVDRLSPTFKVYVLDQARASADDALEIRRIRRFHSVLVLRNGRPLCMWIENDHPENSAVANNVEYVEPKDMTEYQIARFNRYLRVLRHLTDADLRPAHLTELRPTARGNFALEKSSADAA